MNMETNETQKTNFTPKDPTIYRKNPESKEQKERTVIVSFSSLLISQDPTWYYSLDRKLVHARLFMLDPYNKTWKARCRYLHDKVKLDGDKLRGLVKLHHTFAPSLILILKDGYFMDEISRKLFMDWMITLENGNVTPLITRTLGPDYWHDYPVNLESLDETLSTCSQDILVESLSETFFPDGNSPSWFDTFTRMKVRGLDTIIAWVHFGKVQPELARAYFSWRNPTSSTWVCIKARTPCYKSVYEEIRVL